MNGLTLGRLGVSAVIERAGPTRPTWLLPDATPEALERHRDWLAPHFPRRQGTLPPEHPRLRDPHARIHRFGGHLRGQ